MFKIKNIWFPKTLGKNEFISLKFNFKLGTN